MEYRNEQGIRNDFLDHLENDLSKIEGTYNFDIASSVGYITQKLYDYMAYWGLQAFITTATEDIYIDKHANQFGVYRREAGKSTGEITITGKAGTTIPLGTIVINKSGFKYLTAHDLLLNSTGTGIVKIEALEGGTQGNCQELEVNSFEIYDANLYSVYNTNKIEGGYDIEDNKTLIARVQEKVQEPAHSGNIYDYIQWAKEVAGVGSSSCIGCWNGPGTVKVLISDYNSQKAGTDLIQKVKDHIEEVRPVGPEITVESFKILDLDMDIKVQLQAGIDLEDIKNAIIIDLKVANSDGKITRTEGTDKYISIGLITEVLMHIDGIKDCEVSNLSVSQIPSDSIVQISEGLNVTEF